MGIVARYVDDLQRTIAALDVEAVLDVVEVLRSARDARRQVFIAGNGGSAATASHWVNDLAKATRRSGRRPFRVIGLADNLSWVTAIANDDGYDRVFADQLDNLANPGDVLLVISASGNSPNIVRAVALARARGMVSVGLVGFDGGLVAEQLDTVVWVRSEKGEYGLVESMHSIICDIVTTCLIGDQGSAGDTTSP